MAGALDDDNMFNNSGTFECFIGDLLELNNLAVEKSTVARDQHARLRIFDAAMQRFGIRRTVLFSLMLLSFAIGLSTFMTEPWHLVLTWGLMVGIGSGVAATVFAGWLFYLALH